MEAKSKLLIVGINSYGKNTVNLKREKAILSLYPDNWDDGFALAYSIVRRRDLAFEASSNVIFKLLIMEDEKFEKIDYLKNYFFGSVKNEALKIKQTQQRILQINDNLDGTSETNESFFERIFANTQLRSRINLTLRVLSQSHPRYAEIVKLYYFEGFSHQEIADIMDITIANSKTTLNRAKKAFKKIYKSISPDDDPRNNKFIISDKLLKIKGKNLQENEEPPIRDEVHLRFSINTNESSLKLILVIMEKETNNTEINNAFEKEINEGYRLLLHDYDNKESVCQVLEGFREELLIKYFDDFRDNSNTKPLIRNSQLDKLDQLNSIIECYYEYLVKQGKDYQSPVYEETNYDRFKDVIIVDNQARKLVNIEKFFRTNYEYLIQYCHSHVRKIEYYQAQELIYEAFLNLLESNSKSLIGCDNKEFKTYVLMSLKKRCLTLSKSRNEIFLSTNLLQNPYEIEFKDTHNIVLINIDISSSMTFNHAKSIGDYLINNKISGIVSCFKPNERINWINLCRSNERTDDLIVFKKGNPYGIILLDHSFMKIEIDTVYLEAISNLFMKINTITKPAFDKEINEHYTFWHNSIKRSKSRTIEYLRMVDEELSIFIMRKVINSAYFNYQSPKVKWKEIDKREIRNYSYDVNYLDCILEYGLYISKKSKETEHTYNLVYNYFLDELALMSEESKSVIMQSFLDLTEPFTKGILKEYFSGKANIYFNDILEGKIILFDFTDDGNLSWIVELIKDEVLFE